MGPFFCLCMQAPSSLSESVIIPLIKENISLSRLVFNRRSETWTSNQNLADSICPSRTYLPLHCHSDEYDGTFSGEARSEDDISHLGHSRLSLLTKFVLIWCCRSPPGTFMITILKMFMRSIQTWILSPKHLAMPIILLDGPYLSYPVFY